MRNGSCLCLMVPRKNSDDLCANCRFRRSAFNNDWRCCRETWGAWLEERLGPLVKLEVIEPEAPGFHGGRVTVTPHAANGRTLNSVLSSSRGVRIKGGGIPKA